MKSKQEGTAHLKVGHYLSQIGLLVSRAFPQDSRVCLVEKMTMVQDLEGSRFFGNVLKRGYYGTYHKMSPAHLHRYVAEFEGRHNTRRLNTIEQMVMIAEGMDKKQLRYKDLVK